MGVPSSLLNTASLCAFWEVTAPLGTPLSSFAKSRRNPCYVLTGLSHDQSDVCEKDLLLHND